MNYQEMREMFARKCSRLDIFACTTALADCHATLKLWPNESDYTRKLWCEVDALRDRLRALQSRKART